MQAGLRLCCSQTPLDRFSSVEAQNLEIYLNCTGGHLPGELEIISSS